jgi:hypothetical protein
MFEHLASRILGEAVCAALDPRVRAVRVNDRGGCATRVNVLSIANPLMQSIACGFLAAVSGAGDATILGGTFSFGEIATATKDHLKTTSVMMHAAGAPTVEAAGGFIGFFDFRVDFYAPDILGDFWIGAEDIHGNVGYTFALSDEFLVLSAPTRRMTEITSGTVHPSSPFDGLHDAFATTVRTEFAKNAKIAQHVPIPNIAQKEVECADVTECGGPKDTLKLGIDSALSKGMISQQERDALRALAEDSQNWTCERENPSDVDPAHCIAGTGGLPPKLCRFVVRAKRLNFYPRGVCAQLTGPGKRCSVEVGVGHDCGYYVTCAVFEVPDADLSASRAYGSCTTAKTCATWSKYLPGGMLCYGKDGNLTP